MQSDEQYIYSLEVKDIICFFVFLTRYRGLYVTLTPKWLLYVIGFFGT